MKQLCTSILLLCLALLPCTLGFAAEEEYDIVVYGDSSAALTAAIGAQRDGRRVVLVNPTNFLGGMSASGLGATDFGSANLTIVGGVAAEFYKGVAKHYDKGFIRSFEPHVGQQVFKDLAEEAGIEVHFNEFLDREQGVEMDDNRISAITTLSGKTYRAKMFIDATYVGDLMAAAGVSYTVGREAESEFGENLAGVRRGDTQPRVHYTQSDKDHFVADVDPYIIPGDPSSGLLPMIHDLDLVNGTGDKKIQAYNYRMCLSADPDNRIPITKPHTYDPLDHELLIRNFEAGDKRFPALIESLGGKEDKVDWNSMHAVGNDFGGANWDYPEASYDRRLEIEHAHRDYTRGFLWTLAHSPRIPKKIRNYAQQWGLPKDEFTDNGNWPYMIYIREARRMRGEYIMTQHNCMHREVAKDPIALGVFGMDSHVVQYFVNEKGHARREGVIWRTPPAPYGIAYRAIIPKAEECNNLFVPVCLSATHVAHGSIRMEPVFMGLGQAAAAAAGLAIDEGTTVQDVPYGELKGRMRKNRLAFEYKDKRKKRSALYLTGIVVDDTQAKMTGHWEHSTHTKPYYNVGYYHNGDLSDDNAFAQFKVTLPKPGKYKVRFHFPVDDNRATSVRLDIKTKDFTWTRFVNQRDEKDTGRDLGTFEFDTEAEVTIYTANTDGYVVIDALQFIAIT